ncbi:hypothetical protein MPLB_1510065 [Mesorhizobium sp. ORS 3324]|nr:hypothetical protein MPLB_1510065 [Mesorhizobium sp. ORS 3324]
MGTCRACCSWFVVTAGALFYNEVLPAEAGISARPKTLEELIERAKKLPLRRSRASQSSARPGKRSRSLSGHVHMFEVTEAGPPLWLCGHWHDSRDYRFGNTQVVCNPRWYGAACLRRRCTLW